MPWEVKQEGNTYCVFKSDTGAKLRCYPNRTQADEYMATLYSKTNEQLETISSVMLEEGGPVILGVAVTNRPHLPLPAMSVVEQDGQKLIRVPFLRKGIFRHPNGNLIFDDKVFDKMLENHVAKKSHYGVSLDLRHKPELGALAWFDRKGGKIVKENDPEYGELLVGYGKPTSENALEIIENEQYVFASVEFHPKHKSNLIQKLSADDLEEINQDDLVDIALEDIAMEEVTISLEEYDGLKAKADTVAELQAKVAEAEAKITELEAAIVVEEVELIPEKARLQLEAQDKEIKRLKAKALQQDVDLVISKAESYRDSSGRGHSPVLLEITRDAMLGKAIQINEDKAIKLESNSGSDVADYLRKVLVHVLNTVPGQVQFESRTESKDEPSVLEDNTESFSNEELKSFWVESV